MKQIKGILIDLDNTLYDYEPLHQLSLKKVLEYITSVVKCDYAAVEKKFLESRAHVNKSLEDTAASHNRILYFQKMFEDFGLNPIDYVIEAYNVYWDTTMQELTLENDAKDFLDKISKYKIAIVTDLTAHIQFRKLQKMDLSKYVDAVVTSEEAGVEKPHSKIFEKALAKLDLASDEVIMIGDNLKKDCLGAQKLGIKSFWLNRENLAADLPEGIIEIKSLEQVLEYL